MTVTHAAYLFVTHDGPPPLRDMLEDLDVLALLLAALGHDLGHPGTTNAFQARPRPLPPCYALFSPSSFCVRTALSCAPPLILPR